MAVCPSCDAAVTMSANTCSECGATLQIIPEPDNTPIAALKEDIEEYIRNTAPEDVEAAGQELENWSAEVGRHPVAGVQSEEDAEPEVVYNAPDEMSARLVTSLLESEGIDAMALQHTVPMLNTSQQMLEGIWGQVSVHHKDAERAIQLLRDQEALAVSSDGGGLQPSEP